MPAWGEHRREKNKGRRAHVHGRPTTRPPPRSLQDLVVQVHCVTMARAMANAERGRSTLCTNNGGRLARGGDAHTSAHALAPPSPLPHTRAHLDAGAAQVAVDHLGLLAGHGCGCVGGYVFFCFHAESNVSLVFDRATELPREASEFASLFLLLCRTCRARTQAHTLSASHAHNQQKHVARPGGRHAPQRGGCQGEAMYT
jgi:hypothetical protein